jgi:type I restriction enzyme S subunit
MRKGWEIKKLLEVCDFQNGFAFKSKTYKDKGLPILRITNIQNQNLDINKLVYFDINDYKENFDRFKVCKGDLVIAMSGATTGKLGINNSETVFYLNQRVGKFIPNKNIIKSYLYYFLSTKVEESLSIAAGAAQPNLSTEQINNFIIPVPSLSEQKKIVATLDKAFIAIDKAKANANQNLQNAKALFESYLQGVFENKGDDWEEKSLKDVVIKTETIDPTKKPNEEFIYLDVSSVNKETKEIENATVLLGKDAPSRARKMIKTNDVIFATVRPTHSRVALITEEYNEQVCSTGYFVLRAKEFLNNNLLFYFLLTFSFNKQMEKMQKGASYPAVTDAEVKSVLIPFPKSLKTQQLIVQKLDALLIETKKLENHYQQKINDLEELKKSVLQKAFAGELSTGVMAG